ncbi:hypothetical protein GCM10010211_42990 [Streptomyces albospinus]|uniref:Uncharacterized protein n=1 Tax=Streptomyces albospinus TaxID=285515 RepID=A0ABQ2V985_9ACTN|nr:hypothetical protein [Streptomyces albospinus]GGU72568.1 hypothetical protein GCM10010211_42990 [Streptomyces albospinus]
MRMRTALAAAALCSAALMGPAGIAAADDGDHSGDLFGVGNQHMHDVTAQDSPSWIFGDGGEDGGEHGKKGGEHGKDGGEDGKKGGDHRSK